MVANFKWLRAWPTQRLTQQQSNVNQKWKQPRRNQSLILPELAVTLKLGQKKSKNKKEIHTLEAFVVETDLTLELLLGASEVDWDLGPSDEGKSGVPGGVRSLMT